jgi:hypothetical protein
MNKIVIEHYPASKLPQDLREKLEKDATTVRLVMEAEPLENTDLLPGLKGLLPSEREPMTIDEALAAIRRIKAEGRPPVTTEEAVARIRELRDEWDY